MAIPAEAASDVAAVHGLVAGDYVLDGTGEDVAIVREPRCEGRPVIEDVLGLVLGALQLGFECLGLPPQLKDLLLVVWKGEILPFANFVHGGNERDRESGFWSFNACQFGCGFLYIGNDKGRVDEVTVCFFLFLFFFSKNFLIFKMAKECRPSKLRFYNVTRSRCYIRTTKNIFLAVHNLCYILCF